MLIHVPTKIINKQVDRVKINCDFVTSKNCKGIYSVSYKSFQKTRLVNNGKDICNKCASHTKNSGPLNGSFKYKKVEGYFSNINTELKAYLLGWIASRTLKY